MQADQDWLRVAFDLAHGPNRQKCCHLCHVVQWVSTKPCDLQNPYNHPNNLYTIFGPDEDRKKLIFWYVWRCFYPFKKVYYSLKTEHRCSLQLSAWSRGYWRQLSSSRFTVPPHSVPFADSIQNETWILFFWKHVWKLAFWNQTLTRSPLMSIYLWVFFIQDCPQDFFRISCTSCIWRVLWTVYHQCWWTWSMSLTWFPGIRGIRNWRLYGSTTGIGQKQPETCFNAPVCFC